MYTLKFLQKNLPWTIPYSEAYRHGQQPYSDTQHALMHIIKSAGIIAGMIDKADHGEPGFDKEELEKRTADFVMCALRIANTAPTGPFDLEQTVCKRMEAVNKVKISDEMRDYLTSAYHQNQAEDSMSSVDAEVRG